MDYYPIVYSSKLKDNSQHQFNSIDFSNVDLRQQQSLGFEVVVALKVLIFVSAPSSSRDKVSSNLSHGIPFGLN